MLSWSSEHHQVLVGSKVVLDLNRPTILAMSFGRPGSSPILQANPPDRGSFPLDHDGQTSSFCVQSLIPVLGECKEMMKVYLKCLKEHGSASSPCRGVSKVYLDCRMQRSVHPISDTRAQLPLKSHLNTKLSIGVSCNVKLGPTLASATKQMTRLRRGLIQQKLRRPPIYYRTPIYAHCTSITGISFTLQISGQQLCESTSVL